MKMLDVKVDDWTHRNLKALAALKELTVVETLKLLVGKEIEENPDCELCRRFGKKPNEKTIKAMKDMGGKSFKNLQALMRDLREGELLPQKVAIQTRFQATYGNSPVVPTRRSYWLSKASDG